MKNFKVTYRVRDRHNAEIGETRTMALPAPSAAAAQKKVVSIAYKLTKLAYPVVSVLEVK
jgi:hypothetical protein